MKNTKVFYSTLFVMATIGTVMVMASMLPGVYHGSFRQFILGAVFISVGIAGIVTVQIIGFTLRTLAVATGAPLKAVASRLQNINVTRASIDDSFNSLVGQDHVVGPLKQIAAIARANIRLGRANAPKGVLLFLGPTGVGKTEAAKLMARGIFGSEEALLRFDMGQFSDEIQANRFYGSPPGYIGSEKGGQLTQAVKAKPDCVVLLDEVEKAHPKIWDAFLSVFDEGYLTDASTNERIDMTHAVFVLTSNLLEDDVSLTNLSSEKLKEALQQARVSTREGEVRAFRPELLGRINDVFVFVRLNDPAIRQIMRRRLDDAFENLRKQGVKLAINGQTMDDLVREVGNARYGVRQIDDVIRRRLRKELAEQSRRNVTTTICCVD